MCTPTAYFVMTAVSTAYSMKAASDQGDYEQGVAKYNARVAENDAQKTQEKGVEAENIQRQKTAQLLSEQRAQLGAANVNLGTGSAFQLQEDTAIQGEADALRIRRNTGEQVSALQEKSSLLLNQGEAAQTAGQNKAFGSLLKGASSMAGTAVANKWYKPNSAAVAGDAYQPARSYGH